MDTCTMDSCIIHLADLCLMDIDVELEKEVLVNFAWVTRPKRPKGAKDEVKRPEGPPQHIEVGARRAPRLLVDE